MSEFYKGEIAIIVKASHFPEMVGKDCEILDDIDSEGDYRIDVPGFTHGGKGFFAQPEWLRKKKPPQELGRWEDVKEFGLWDPFKVTAPKEKQKATE